MKTKIENNDNHRFRPWEDWQLTAYVLGELEPDLVQQIANAQAADPKLAAEIQSIRSTLDQITVTLKQEPKSTLGSQRSIEFVNKIGQAVDSKAVKPVRNESAQSVKPAIGLSVALRGRSRRLVLGGVFAAAACVLVSVLLTTSPKMEPTFTLQRTPFTVGPITKGGSIGNAPVSHPLDEFGNVQVESVDELGLSKVEGEKGMNAGMGMSMGAASIGGGMAGMSGMDMRGMGGMPGMEGMPGPMGAMPSGTTPNLSASSNSGNPRVSLSRLADSADAKPPSVFYYAPTVALNEALVESESSREWRFSRESKLPYSTDKYASIEENRFTSVSDEPLSTFSIDVDTASYTKVRQFLKEIHALPPRNAVRVEEMVNYFDYQYEAPDDGQPFNAHLAVANAPWSNDRHLVRIALQAKKVDFAKRPQANIVFLLDVSGSMADDNKLPLVKETMRMMIEQLGENDRIAMVVYAGAAGCVLESTTGDQQATILAALDRLHAGGSTNGGQGIQLAYDIARDHFIPGGINRVVLCTDGDFNVGVTSTEALVNMVATHAKSKIFLTVLGYGAGNTNDAMMEQIANRGNGIYGFVDSRREAKRQMVKQLAGNLMTVAKDVKIQVEFNPAKVQEYRLIGYENRMLATEDFNNDKKDAGEIGAGHRVTALYEIVPVGAQGKSESPVVDDLRYQPKKPASTKETEPAASKKPNDFGRGQPETALSNELLAVKLRYKEPEGDKSSLLTFPLEDSRADFDNADADFRWAVCVAQFGMLLRNSQHANTTWPKLLSAAESAAGTKPDASRQECLEMIETAMRLMGN